LDRRGAAVCFTEAIEHVSKNTDGLHLSFDLDGVDPREAPGVGTPVPGGLSLRESHLICEMLAETNRLVGMEMVELNPILDVANQTGKLAVWLIQSALGKSIL
jgi:arginase